MELLGPRLPLHHRIHGCSRQTMSYMQAYMHTRTHVRTHMHRSTNMYYTCTFQVRRVGDDCNFDLFLSNAVDPLQTHPQVVFDISRPLQSHDSHTTPMISSNKAHLVLRLQLGVKLTENSLKRLACDVGQHIQTSSVGLDKDYRQVKSA